MLIRLWRTSFKLTQKQRLVEYANNISLPVLSSRAGNCGVFFYSEGDQWTTMTLWEDQQSIDDLAGDPEYRQTVEGLLALNVLGDDQQTDVYELNGNSLAT